MDKAKCTKIKHSSESAANNVITKAWAGHLSWNGKALPVRCYKCWCNAWHLTSKPFMTKEELANKIKVVE